MIDFSNTNLSREYCELLAIRFISNMIIKAEKKGLDTNSIQIEWYGYGMEDLIEAIFGRKDENSKVR